MSNRGKAREREGEGDGEADRKDVISQEVTIMRCILYCFRASCIHTHVLHLLTTMQGFREKNRDLMRQDVVDVLKTSKMDLVRALIGTCILYLVSVLFYP